MAITYTSGIWAVKDGHDDEFVAAWSEFVDYTREMDGAGTFRLLRDVDRPGRFMSFGDWESHAAQEAWKQTDEFSARMRRVLEHAELESSTYELVTEVA
jgi:heme-degrading monooxygenase HmoA